MRRSSLAIIHQDEPARSPGKVARRVVKHVMEEDGAKIMKP